MLVSKATPPALLVLLLPSIAALGVSPAATELKQRLSDSFRDQAEPDRARVDELVSALVGEKDKPPFDASVLGGGLWAAVHTSGPVPRWEKYSRLLPKLRNVRGQQYTPTGDGVGEVLNYGEIAGPALYFSATGTFRENDAGAAHFPKDFDVDVESGGLTVLGLRVPLPISGAGFLRLEWADESMRIVSSPRASPDNWEESGLVVVQMRVSELEPEWQPGWLMELE